VTRFAFVNQIVKELRDARLWPIAVGLLVALVAIPVVLSKPAKSPSSTVPSTPPSAASAVSELKPIVELTSASTQSERKSVQRLPRKNPFAPLVHAQSDAGTGSAPGGLASAGIGSGTTGSSGATAATGGGTAGSTSGSVGSTGGGSTGGGSTGSTGSSGGGTNTTTSYTYMADVRFGEVGKTKQYDVLQLRALPSSDVPVVVFMGATSEGDTAVFLVGSGAAVTGEGKCKPTEDECVFLYLKPDETAQIAVGDATGALTTYELKLREIKVKKLDQPPTADGASTSTAARKSDGRSASRVRRARAKGFFQLFGQLGF
jgi:hypothetical protein